MRQAAAGLLCVALLSGCERVEQFYSSKLPVDTATDWWHQLQGGVIANERPPPPGVDDPYPNLGTIPARPTPTDATTRRSLAARLGGERDRAERAAGQDPIVTPQPGVAARKPVAGEAAAEPMARIEAAEAPAAARAVAPVPVGPPAPASIQATAAATAPPRDVPPGGRFVTGPVPALPTGAPPLPTLAGMPAAAMAVATPRPAAQVVAVFLPQSAVLRPDSDAALRALAGRRSGGRVALLGGGDAGSAEPGAQAAALPLAWRRARAMADVLVAAGVPVAAMRIDAAALGRGGVARLVE